MTSAQSASCRPPQLQALGASDRGHAGSTTRCQVAMEAEAGDAGMDPHAWAPAQAWPEGAVERRAVGPGMSPSPVRHHPAHRLLCGEQGPRLLDPRRRFCLPSFLGPRPGRAHAQGCVGKVRIRESVEIGTFDIDYPLLPSQCRRRKLSTQG